MISKGWKPMLAAAILAAGCGGSSDQVAGVDRGGIRVAIVTKGEITGFGSVVVNGIRYETANATIIVDGSAGTEQDLAPGAVVTITGEIEQGTASGTAAGIEFDDNVEGNISALDTSGGTLNVLGQTVRISLDTLFEGDVAVADIGGLAIGDAVEISGFERADGSIDATLVRLKAAPDNLEVTGVAAQVDAAAFTLRIGALTVDYSAAMLDGFTGGAPANGDRVEAKGTQQGAGGELIADSVALKSPAISEDNQDDEASIEGVVTRFVEAADFDVDGQPVTTDGDTRYENGDAGSLAEDIRLEVDGVVIAGGVVLAREIEFRRSSQARVEGPVDALSTDDRTLTVIGVGVDSDEKTIFQDKSDQRLRPFSLGDISPGDYVRVAGSAVGDRVTAKSVRREDPDDEVKLRALAADLAEPEFRLLGVTVRTDAGTRFKEAGQDITAGQFFQRAGGRIVEAEGTLDNGALVAGEVEIED